jgi:hypothetical protein
MSELHAMPVPAPPSRLKRLITRHSLVAFFVIAFAGAWTRRAVQPARPVGEAASQEPMRKEMRDDGKMAFIPGDIPVRAGISPLPSRDVQGQPSHNPS